MCASRSTVVLLVLELLIAFIPFPQSLEMAGELKELIIVYLFHLQDYEEDFEENQDVSII